MITVTIDVQGLKTKLKALEDAVAPETLLKVIGARLVSFVDESFRTEGRGKWKSLSSLTTLIRGNAPPLQRTPTYKQSFVTSSDGRTYVEIGTRHPAAPFQEYGTNPYTIKVRRAKTLAAPLLSGGFIFFGPVVKHPGIPARPVLPTTQEVERIIPPVIDAMISKAVSNK